MPPPSPPPRPPCPYLYKLGALNWLALDGFFCAELTAMPPDPARLGKAGDLTSGPLFRYPELRFYPLDPTTVGLFGK